MPPTTAYESDQERNARKYDRLVVALRHTTEIIHKAELNPTLEIAPILEELLPHFVKALEAEQGFIARRPVLSTRHAAFALTFSYPQAVAITTVRASPLLLQLVTEGGARIVDAGDAQTIIGEFSGLCTHSAILAVLHTLDYVYLIGLCDKQGAEHYPFLAADRRVLENLLTLMAVGLRTVERQQRELRIIQEISQKVAVGGAAQPDDSDSVWQLIARRAAELTNAQYGVIYAYEPRATG